jgi:hypothetical protein
MIRIAITGEAFDAIAATLQFGSTMYEAKATSEADTSCGWIAARSTSFMRCGATARTTAT